MREIKFRGKRTDNGEWVYGGIVITEDSMQCGENSIFSNCYIVEFPKDLSVDAFSRGNAFWTHNEFIQIDPATVGQYTELKDKNGLEIYEGDILRDSEGTYVIQWFEGGARFIAICADAYILGDRDEVGEAWELIWVNCEVIGDIHDNQELLEGG